MRKHRRAVPFGDHQQYLGGKLPVWLALLGGGQGGDVFADLAQRRERFAVRKGNRIVESLRPVSGMVPHDQSRSSTRLSVRKSAGISDSVPLGRALRCRRSRSREGLPTAGRDGFSQTQRQPSQPGAELH